MTKANDKLMEEAGQLQQDHTPALRGSASPQDINWIDLMDLETLRQEAEEEVARRKASGEMQALWYLCNGKAQAFLDNGRTYIADAMKRKGAWTPERSDKLEESMRKQATREFQFNEANDQLKRLKAAFQETYGERWMPYQPSSLDQSENATVKMAESALEYFASLRK